jgi:hypothetical protein
VNVEFPQIVHTHIGATDVHVKFGLWGPKAEEMLSQPHLLATRTIRIGASSTLASDYIDQWVDRTRQENVNRVAIGATSDESYTVQFSDSQHFVEGQAFLDNVSLRRLDLTVSAEIFVMHGQVLSIFDVESRGRMLKVGTDLGGLQMRVDIVELTKIQDR